ncbi:MAG: hypothetical protein Q7V04_05460, partial [Deltaproteobacteria bacterium]|nr:hypothetical protein [Deltaproteobacteria bacterium]
MGSALALNGGTIRSADNDDAELNLYSVGATTGVKVDGVAPTVTSVTVPGNATYTAGQQLDFTVNFSENITLSGTDSTLGLTIGGSSVTASYSSNTATGITYRYTVQNNDNDTDGIAVGAITLNTTTITDAATNNANIALNSVGATASVLVDAVAPTVTSVSVPPNTTYIAGQHLDFTVNFTENVTVNTSGGTPHIPVTLDTGGIVNASYITGTGTSAIVFRYTIATGNLDSNGIALGSAIIANGGTIKDAATNDATTTLNSVGSTTAILVDAVAPTVTSVTVPGNATYVAGQQLDFTVSFSENVTITGTDSTLGLTIGGSSVSAAQLSNTATSITYRYTVQNNDNDTDGITVGNLTLNSSTINDAATNSANIALNSVGSTTAVLVDALAPTVTSVTVPGNATYTTGQQLDFTVNFSENIAVTG